MMFSCCCGVGATHALNALQKKMNDCWQWTQTGSLNTPFEYTIPKTGYYAISISSYGADVYQAKNLVKGTAFYVGKFTKGDIIRGTLGNFAQMQKHSSQAYFNGVSLNSLENGDGNQYPAFNIRWIGNGNLLSPAKILPLPELEALKGNSFINCRTFSDGTSVLDYANKHAFAPSNTDWQKMDENKAHWYVQDVHLSQTGTYTIYVLGDDEQRLAINGTPVVWSNADWRISSSDCENTRKSNTFNVENVGVHQFMVMQVNIPSGTPSWVAVLIRDPSGNEINIVGNWQYFETSLDCDNNTIVPTGDLPTVGNTPNNTNSSDNNNNNNGDNNDNTNSGNDTSSTPKSLGEAIKLGKGDGSTPNGQVVDLRPLQRTLEGPNIERSLVWEGVTYLIVTQW